MARARLTTRNFLIHVEALLAIGITAMTCRAGDDAGASNGSGPELAASSSDVVNSK